MEKGGSGVCCWRDKGSSVKRVVVGGFGLWLF